MNEDVKADDLKVSIQSLKPVIADKKVEIAVRLSNTAARALHYISDVRATKYDPATKTLTLSLSDEGREVIPGTIRKLPVIRHIDPASQAEIRLTVPDRVIKLSRSAPPGKLAFEKHEISEVEEIVVEVAWADVPFYKETRPGVQDRSGRLPAARWEQHKARATKRLRDEPQSTR